MTPRPSYAQLEALVEFLEENPGIAKGILRSQVGKFESKKKWAKFAKKVNTLGELAKDGPSWSKYWAEKKCGMKKLCAQRLKLMKESGGEGGVEDIPGLTPLDQRMIAVIGDMFLANSDANQSINPLSKHGNFEPNTEVKPNFSKVNILNTDQVHGTATVFMEEEDDQESNYVPSERARPRSRSCSSRKTAAIDDNMEILTRIELRRIGAEQANAQALQAVASSIDNCAKAIEKGTSQVAQALLEIAKKL